MPKVCIEPGFTWEDQLRGHLVVCADATDPLVIRVVVERAGRPDLVLLDPPYGLSSEAEISFAERSNLGLNETWDRFDARGVGPLLEALLDAALLAVGEGNLYVWTSDWWLSDVKRRMQDAGLRVWPTYVWTKPNPPPSVRKACLVSACEFLAMASKGSHFFDLGAFPKQRNYFVAPGGEPIISRYWVERPVVNQGERLRRLDGSYLNKTQKPLDLTEAVVRGSCPEGGLVLDLCGGTGTATVAADRAGRRAVYVERDPAQVAAVIRRLGEDRARRSAA